MSENTPPRNPAAVEAAILNERRLGGIETNQALLAVKLDATNEAIERLRRESEERAFGNNKALREGLDTMRRESGERQEAILAEVKRINGSVATVTRGLSDHVTAHATEGLDDFEEVKGNVDALMAASHDGSIRDSVWKMQAKWLTGGIGLGGSVIYILHLLGVL